MTDWNKIAETLENRSSFKVSEAEEYAAAIALCRRMAAGELVERSEVWELARKVHFVCAGVPDPTPTPDAADKTEREHCERVWMTWDYCAPETGLELLIRERAAVRAECQAEIERLRARVRELEEHSDRLIADVRYAREAYNNVK